MTDIATDGAARPRGRDREATERALLEAARDLLAVEGFRAFGINAVARRAGCDKQLVYRYFGGHEGLVDAIGVELGSWVTEHLAPFAALGAPASYADLIERLGMGFLHALRSDPLMQKIIAWEISDPSPQVRRLADARSRALSGWVARTRGSLVPPPDVDAAAVNAVLIAAIQHLVLSSSTSGQFAGMPLETDADWERIRMVLRKTIRALCT